MANYYTCRKKSWCPTRSDQAIFWGQIGRGRCRLDCDGKNLKTENLANLATQVFRYLNIRRNMLCSCCPGLAAALGVRPLLLRALAGPLLHLQPARGRPAQLRGRRGALPRTLRQPPPPPDLPARARTVLAQREHSPPFQMETGTECSYKNIFSSRQI